MFLHAQQLLPDWSMVGLKQNIFCPDFNVFCTDFSAALFIWTNSQRKAFIALVVT